MGARALKGKTEGEGGSNRDSNLRKKVSLLADMGG